jgi:hypothetical protein
MGNRRRLRVLVAASLTVIASAACGSDRGPDTFASSEATKPLNAAWAAPLPGRDPEARASFDELRRAYASCRSYRDLGTVTSTFRGAGHDHSKVERFDTIFVRGVGLRLRYYDEHDELRFGIWRRGDQTRDYFLGRATERTFDSAIASMQGVTNLVSGFAPRFLYSSQRNAKCTQRMLETAAPCASCVRLLSDCGRTETYDVLVIDSVTHALHRFESTDVMRPDPAEHEETLRVLNLDPAALPFDPTPYLSEDIIAYAPEFDVEDEDALRHEIETQPW